MKIKPSTKNYFTFELNKNERANVNYAPFIDEFKAEIQHGQRLWFSEKRCWRVHNDKFGILMDLLWKHGFLFPYLQKLFLGQEELFQ